MLLHEHEDSYQQTAPKIKNLFFPPWFGCRPEDNLLIRASKITLYLPQEQSHMLEMALLKEKMQEFALSVLLSLFCLGP